MRLSIRGEKDGSGRGEWDFLAIPSRGDRITIPSGRSIEILEVLYVEHSPGHANPTPSAAPARMTVVVKNVGWWDG
jgi:hypothetical protein